MQDLVEYLKKAEILIFVWTKYPMFPWSLRTLCPCLRYFDIKCIDCDRNRTGNLEASGARTKSMKSPRIHWYFVQKKCNIYSLFRFDVFHQILPQLLTVSPAIISYSRRRDVAEVLRSELGAYSNRAWSFLFHGYLTRL